jgi:hypothetical protein
MTTRWVAITSPTGRGEFRSLNWVWVYLCCSQRKSLKSSGLGHECPVSDGAEL